MGSRETRVREQINFGVWAFDHQPARDLRRRPRGAQLVDVVAPRAP